ncbi:coiled-coil domain-containing protein 25 isoform X2 [Tachysurus fulvidraco]|uniref:coiled-coil domain-containing protein 25 isoform X2 n=1 Tax=Tachysurus fulvidraco TaxID=1234273 RepID=UPI001FEE3FB6|nr:coiled-coil domain-containing protein 25 isoform X2 [Tachysurus fulvidraco]
MENILQPILSNPYFQRLFYDFLLTINFCSESEERPIIKNVCAKISGRLSEILKVNNKDKEEKSDVDVFFCPIVSRAGTDIEAALTRVRRDKPTIVFVLHHTFSTEYIAPNSSRYERENLLMVDVLFHEDSGLLKCSKNNEAITKAGNYSRKYARRQLNVKKLALMTSLSVFTIVLVTGLYKAWKSPAHARVNMLSVNYYL